MEKTVTIIIILSMVVYVSMAAIHQPVIQAFRALIDTKLGEMIRNLRDRLVETK
ncbi:MAG: hypothetical protein HYT62_04280 [Candidatus Yanofskybacteria bacterium]|nr:hypothetical protein [Candidatus Yanofskybacteria bacterium]